MRIEEETARLQLAHAVKMEGLRFAALDSEGKLADLAERIAQAQADQADPSATVEQVIAAKETELRSNRSAKRSSSGSKN